MTGSLRVKSFKAAGKAKGSAWEKKGGGGKLRRLKFAGGRAMSQKTIKPSQTFVNTRTERTVSGRVRDVASFHLPSANQGRLRLLDL